MSKINFGELKDMQQQIANQLVIEDSIKIDEIRHIAGFDVSYLGDKCVCAVVVLDFKTMQVVERKFIESKVPMNYVPGFLAFREGPLICQAYFDLETDPDVLIVDGAGIAHPMNAGLASFVGVELGKPVIGVAKNLTDCTQKDDLIYLGENVVGRAVISKEHANPLFVSPGNMISIDTAAEIIKRCVIPPHKLPEPLHMAHRFADKCLKNKNENKELENKN